MTDPRDALEQFLVELEKLLDSSTEPTAIHLSGGAAVALGYGGNDKTKDVDAFGPLETALEPLRSAAGRNSSLHKKTGLFFEVVPPIFPRAGGAQERSHPVVVPGLRILRVHVMDAHDLVISKLKRFSAGDREDIELLVRIPGFRPAELLRLYEDARAWYHYERDILEEIDTNFNRVRVEMLGLAPEDWSGEY